MSMVIKPNMTTWNKKRWRTEIVRAFAKRYLMFEIPIYFEAWEIPVHPWLMPIGIRCYRRFSAEVQSNEWADLFKNKTLEEFLSIINMGFAVYRNSLRWQDIFDSQGLSCSVIRAIPDPGVLNLWNHVPMPGFARFLSARARDPSLELYCQAVQASTKEQMQSMLAAQAPLYGAISFGFGPVDPDSVLTLGGG